jgi:hypothetical protein
MLTKKGKARAKERAKKFRDSNAIKLKLSREKLSNNLELNYEEEAALKRRADFNLYHKSYKQVQRKEFKEYLAQSRSSSTSSSTSASSIIVKKRTARTPTYRLPLKTKLLFTEIKLCNDQVTYADGILSRYHGHGHGQTLRRRQEYEEEEALRNHIDRLTQLVQRLWQICSSSKRLKKKGVV